MRHTNTRRSKSNRSNGKRPYNNGHNRNFESNSSSTKLRGSASQVFEKYVALARDASSSGDRVSAENFFQHAEHYFRIQNLMSPEKKPRDLDKPLEETNPSQKVSEESPIEGKSESQLIDGEAKKETEGQNKKEATKDSDEKEEPSKTRHRKRRNSQNSKNIETSDADTIG